MENHFERKPVGHGTRLMTTTCRECRAQVAASGSQRALKIVEAVHSIRCRENLENIYRGRRPAGRKG